MPPASSLKKKGRSPSPSSPKLAKKKVTLSGSSPAKKTTPNGSKVKKPANTPKPPKKMPVEEDEEEDEEIFSDDYSSLTADDDESVDYILFIDQDDTATKRVLWLRTFAVALLAVLLFALPPVKEFAAFGITNVATARLLGSVLVGLALVLFAASRSEYAAQKKTLQYSMVMNVMIIAGILSNFSQAAPEHKTLLMVWLGADLGEIAVTIWACYFYVQKQDDDLIEEEDEEEEEDNE